MYKWKYTKGVKLKMALAIALHTCSERTCCIVQYHYINFSLALLCEDVYVMHFF
jgi:hypothetical protein